MCTASLPCLLPPPFYIVRKSDRCPHALICTPSTSCANSVMHPLGVTLSFYGCVDPPSHHSPDNYDFPPYTLTPAPPYISHSIISLPPISLARSFCLSLSSNYCINSPLSLLATHHSLLLISPLTLSPRRSSLSTPLRSARSTPLCLFFSIFLHSASIVSDHHPQICLLRSAHSISSLLISDFSAHAPL